MLLRDLGIGEEIWKEHVGLMRKLKEALDWDRFEEPRRTEIYRLLNSASWIACCEYSESMNSLFSFLGDFVDNHPEWKQDFIDFAERIKIE